MSGKRWLLPRPISPCVGAPTPAPFKRHWNHTGKRARPRKDSRPEKNPCCRATRPRLAVSGDARSTSCACRATQGLFFSGRGSLRGRAPFSITMLMFFEVGRHGRARARTYRQGEYVARRGPHVAEEFEKIEKPSHFLGDGLEMGSQMAYGALETRTDSSRTRRIQPRRRESPQRATSNSNRLS